MQISKLYEVLGGTLIAILAAFLLACGGGLSESEISHREWVEQQIKIESFDGLWYAKNDSVIVANLVDDSLGTVPLEFKEITKMKFSGQSYYNTYFVFKWKGVEYTMQSADTSGFGGASLFRKGRDTRIGGPRVNEGQIDQRLTAPDSEFVIIFDEDTGPFPAGSRIEVDYDGPLKKEEE